MDVYSWKFPHGEDAEAPFQGLPYIQAPQFDEGYESIYLMFLCSIECGLRIGEAIGIRVKQF